MPTEADLLADLLEGKVDAADVPAEIAELASLAGKVSQHVTLVPPTDAFRAALREEVVQAAGGAGGVGGAGGAGGGGAASAGGAATTIGGGLSAIVAGVAATAVLAAGTVTIADRAGPGDLLAGLDRALESGQLAIADEEREAELLVDFAAERVLEAVGLVDTEVVDDLLRRAEDLLDRALVLAAEQGRDLDQLLEPYHAALLTLASRSEDPDVQARISQLLVDAGLTDGGLLGGGDAPSPAGDAPGGQDEDGAASDSDGTQDSGDDLLDDPLDVPTEPLVEPTGPLDGLDDPVELPTEPLDELDDPVEVPTEPLDELTDELEDTTDALEDTADDLVGSGP